MGTGHLLEILLCSIPERTRSSPIISPVVRLNWTYSPPPFHINGLLELVEGKLRARRCMRERRTSGCHGETYMCRINKTWSRCMCVYMQRCDDGRCALYIHTVLVLQSSGKVGQHHIFNAQQLVYIRTFLTILLI